MIEVVIPAHNAETFLRETLESVAAQTRLPLQVTVVDDRSRDGTRGVAKRAAAELAPPLRIKVVATEGPPGPSAARNTAIRASRAEFIALLDADDLFLPTHLAELAGLLEANPRAVLAFGDSTLFESATGRVLVPSHHASTRLVNLPTEPASGGGWTLGRAGFRHLLIEPRVATSACLFRRKEALAAGLFDEAMMFTEDSDFFLRLALLGEFVFTRAPVGRKRIHGTNLSNPRNRVRFMHGAARLAVRLDAIAAGSGEPRLTVGAEDRMAIQRNLGRTFDRWLYEASLTCLADYREAARDAARARYGHLALRPRHVGRMLRTLLGGRLRQQSRSN
ncbi:glycosyltransferase family 2 protein [Belnapia moabensis]|uniref:glycosyltransferase family 2 protein n=1 Tax=Belnapia moabensis TaxID=365533 RepID=UPI0005BA6233|nr:glycosyltransferase family 2 protein [Belnapia moabensis]